MNFLSNLLVPIVLMSGMQVWAIEQDERSHAIKKAIEIISNQVTKNSDFMESV